MATLETEQLPLKDALLIKPKVWRDARGYFLESWRQERYAAVGIDLPFVQDNHSCSVRGTLRGLHFQRNFPQGKLVSVSLGTIYDVIVDIRPQSPSFGRWCGVTLSEENQHQLWVPPGMAHGFVVLSEITHFHYKCTDTYHPEDEGSLLWNDPTLNISWPKLDYILSPKDAAAPTWNVVFA